MAESTLEVDSLRMTEPGEVAESQHLISINAGVKKLFLFLDI